MHRLDCHIHIGEIFSTFSRKEGNYKINVEDVINYVEKQKITHFCAFYTKYEQLDDFKKCKKTIYPVKWVSSLEEVVDSSQTGCKFHSHRGPVEDSNFYKYNYSDEKLKNYLKSLPKDFKCFFHTQNPTSLKKYENRVEHVVDLALQFPDLKFIICHSGNFSLRTYYPSKEGETKYFSSFFKTAFLAEVAVYSSIVASKKLENIFLDSSIILPTIQHSKTVLLSQNSEKLLLGSDFPFVIKAGPYHVKDQEKTLLKFNSNINIEEIHLNGIKLLEGV